MASLLTLVLVLVPPGVRSSVHDRERANAVASEKAILVRVQREDASGIDDPLAELQGLVKTAGAEAVAGLVQRRPTPDPATYLGSGKLEELATLVEHHEADVVIFDNDLSPGQTRNLEKRLETKVIDRTELILDIFATHAQTYEARLAVELAQLEYSLPRLKQMWNHLSRLKMGVGMRGPGEKQLEVDRRLVEKRIHELRLELRVIEERKERLVASRSDRMTVCLVGYTNAGKSTLMNRLTDAEVLAEDKLFATLDTRTRRWHLPGWGPVLLSDTVGFIRELPHRLIASFKATLEEARGADLLLHVCDASNPAVLDQISAVYSVLEELKIEEIDTLLVVNKIDQLPDQSTWAQIRNRYPKSVAISARTGEGLDRLAQAVSEGLSHGFLDLDVEMPVDEGKLMSYLSEHGEVLSRIYHEDRVVFHVRLPKQHYGRILKPNVSIKRRDDSEVETD